MSLVWLLGSTTFFFFFEVGVILSCSPSMVVEAWVQTFSWSTCQEPAQAQIHYCHWNIMPSPPMSTPTCRTLGQQPSCHHHVWLKMQNTWTAIMTVHSWHLSCYVGLRVSSCRLCWSRSGRSCHTSTQWCLFRDVSVGLSVSVSLFQTCALNLLHLWLHLMSLSLSISLSHTLSLSFSLCLCLSLSLSFSFFPSLLPTLSLSSYLSILLPNGSPCVQCVANSSHSIFTQANVIYHLPSIGVLA